MKIDKEQHWKEVQEICTLANNAMANNPDLDPVKALKKAGEYWGKDQ